MENVLLIIHLIIAVFLIGLVLLQRSEGGALGIGGGGGGLVSSRGATTALGKATWVLAGAFICTSLVLTIIAATNASSRSVIDRLETPVEAPASSIPVIPGAEGGGELDNQLEGLIAPVPGAASPATTPPAAD